jgi:glycosyltransferase involved in cell wall biosynthesis
MFSLAPNIDVILPVGTDGPFLDQAINSIKKSTGVNARILLVDNTIKGISKIKDRLDKRDLVFREEERGFAHAMNAPLKSRHKFADFVAIMNSDDLVHGERFHRQITKLQQTKTQLNICSVQNFTQRRGVEPFFGGMSYTEYTPILLTLGAYGIEPTWVTRNTWWEEHSHRNSNIHPDIVDLECALKSFPTTRISCLPEKLYFYRKHRNQMSRNAASEMDYSLITPLIMEFLDFYSISNIELRTFFLSRPHNMFKLKLSREDRSNVENHLSRVKDILNESIASQTQLTEIAKILDIRRSALSKRQSFTRLIQTKTRNDFSIMSDNEN